MRFFEDLYALFPALLWILDRYTGQQQEINDYMEFLVLIQALIIFFGYFYEGVRIVQIPPTIATLLTFTSNLIQRFLYGQIEVSFFGLYVAGQVVYWLLRIKYGTFTLEHLEPTGPY
jgi:hypothetical protein